MKTTILPVICGLVFHFFAPVPRVVAQENTVAVGYVSSGGNLLSAANSLGGNLSSSRPDTGEFHLTLDAPGAFVGAGIGDFMVHATVRSAAASDRNAVSEIASVSDDSLTVVVYVSDVEDPTNPSLAEAVNSPFQFVIHRFPPVPTLPAASRFLYATGAVASNGELLGATAVDGSIVASERTATGDYRLTFASPFGFLGQGISDYLVIATPRSSSLLQDNLAVGVVDGIAGDQLIATVNTSDVQNPSETSPDPEDTAFQFAVYRTIPSAASGPAESGLIVGVASVDGSNGLLRRGGIFAPGGFVTAERTGNGIYSVVFHAPGRFAGRTLDDFCAQAGINAATHSDEIVGALPFLIDSDRLTIEVRTNDAEQNGDLFGTGVNRDFFLVVHDARAFSQPDLRIGRAPSLTTMRADGRYNASAAGQRITLSARGARAFRVHFASENDGNTTEAVRVRGRAGKGLSATRCFRLTGGRENVTAAFRSAGHLAEAIRPTETVRYLARPKFSPRTTRRSSGLRIFARPGHSATPGDVVLATLRKR